ncbi:hypothetical protein J6590_096906 [Homalodisca vitripennis]|nr:hypothetical protein J6590_096906 [Homalodisca vitripennis]
MKGILDECLEDGLHPVLADEATNMRVKNTKYNTLLGVNYDKFNVLTQLIPFVKYKRNILEAQSVHGDLSCLKTSRRLVKDANKMAWVCVKLFRSLLANQSGQLTMAN